MRATVHFVRAIVRTLQDRRGTAALIVGVTIVVIIGIAGFVIDIGHAYAVQRSLQASTDAAALAGAQDINCCAAVPNQAIATAIAYSAVAGGRNASPNVTVTMVSGYPALKCFKSTGVSCTGSSAANGIVVQQQATVPTWFGQVLGIGSIPIKTTSTAGVAGGVPKALDVMLVLDTTASMNNPDSSCSIKGATRLTCALAGARILMNQLAPTADHIGLMVFPGLTNASQTQYEYDCNATNPAIAKYSAAPVYQILPLSSDYRTSNSATSLNAASNLVRAAQGGGSGCGQGVSAVGGVGTFYADAITAAQSALLANGQATSQKVIIFLSDGDANATAANLAAAKVKNQCHAAITAAQTATAAGTWVYSIAYGASTSPTPGSCSTDTPAISACATMQQIASDSTKFFSDNVGGASACASAAHSISELVSVFQAITHSLMPPRLLPDDTM